MKQNRISDGRGSYSLRRPAVLLLLILTIAAVWGDKGRMRAEAAPLQGWSVVGPNVPVQVVQVVNGNGTLYALTGSGANDVWSYSGTQWTRMPGSPGRATALVERNGTLYVGTSAGSDGIWSYDGAAWTLMPGSPGSVNALVDVNGTLYAALAKASESVWSYDGTVWSPMPGSPGLIYDLLDVNGTLVAGSPFGLTSVWSYDGAAWTLMPGSPGMVRSLAEVNGVLYAGAAGTGNSVWSYDGATWTRMPGSPSRADALLDVNGTLFAGALLGANSVWSYNGAAWTQMPDSPSMVASLAEWNGTLVAVGNSRVWSYDGTMWTGSPGNVAGFAEWNGTLYRSAASGGHDVWVYDGTTWLQVPGSPSYVTSLLKRSGTLVAGTQSDGVWEYDGSTWTRMPGSPSRVGSLLEANGRLFAGTSYGSDDVWSYDGASWTRLPGSPGHVSSLSQANGKLYAGRLTGSSDVWSYDGTTWASVPGSLNWVLSLTEVNGTLYAGIAGGVPGIWSYDGTAWTPMPDSPGWMYAIAEADGKLIAGTQTGGVWSYDGSSWVSMPGSPSYVRRIVYKNKMLYTAGIQVEQLLFPPDAPAHLQADLTGSTHAVLTWDPVISASGYNVYASVYGSPDGNPPAAAGVSSPPYTVKGLMPGTLYTIAVSAVNAAGESAKSSPVVIRTAAIGSVQMTPGSGNVLGGGTLSVAGVVYDVHSVPVPNAVVDLSGSAGSWTRSGRETESVTADVYGRFSAAWIAPAVSVRTTATISAHVYGANVTPTVLPIEVAPPVGIVSATLPDATVDSGYSHTVAAVGGFPPYRWELVSGALPGGLELDIPTGIIRGTPSAEGSYPISLRIADSYGNTAERNMSIRVQAADSSGGTANPPSGPANPAPPAPSAPGEHPPNPSSVPDVFRDGVVDRTEVIRLIESSVQEGSKSPSFVQLTDIKGHWAEKTILLFVKLGVIQGYPDGTFKPDNPITRAEFAAMTARLFGLRERADTVFTDLAGHWAEDAVLRLAHAGIINGYEDSTFRPDKAVSREEMAVMLYRVLVLGSVPKDRGKGGFVDLSDSYAAEQIKVEAEAGIVSGRADGRFEPKSGSTRAEALTIVLNALTLDPEINGLLISLRSTGHGVH